MQAAAAPSIVASPPFLFFLVERETHAAYNSIFNTFFIPFVVVSFSLARLTIVPRLVSAHNNVNKNVLIIRKKTSVDVTREQPERVREKEEGRRAIQLFILWVNFFFQEQK